MAGTVVAGTMSDGTNSGSTTDMIKGSARAWVNFNGTVAGMNGTDATGIRASYNVSSITDLGTGYYRVNFTTPFSDINYSAVGMAGTITSNANYQRLLTVENPQASYIDLYHVLFSGSNSDTEFASLAIFK